MIHGRYGGMAFRESKTYKFKDLSPFLPHVFLGSTVPKGVRVNFSPNSYSLF